MSYCIFCLSLVVMKIIAGLKMPYEKQDQVAQIRGQIRALLRSFFFSSPHRKIFAYKSLKRKYSLIRAVLLPQNDLSVSCTVQKRVPVNVSPMKNREQKNLERPGIIF